MDGGGDSEESHLHHPFKLSPLLIGLIGIVSGSIMVALYQWITIGFNHYRGATLNPTPLQRQRNSHNPARTTGSSNNNRTAVAQLQVVPVYKYTKGCREGICAVCLCEFSEGEEIRTLPQCMHSFHAPCVDMWLYSHSNCPLCRAHTSPPRQHLVVQVPNSDEAPPPELESLPELEEA